MLPGARGDAELQEGAEPQGRGSHGEEKPVAGLPLCRKLCYAVGGIPYQMTGNALGFFLQIFLLDVVQLEPFHASLILFLGRAWDAVTDPAVGFLVGKSPRRKYGKLIPWIACSTPLGVLCYCMMWSTLADGAPVSLKFLWYLFTYNFFQICMTCYHVPYSSLTMFLGGTQRDRDSATAYRMGMEVFSTLLGSGIQGQMVGAYHGRMTNGCFVGNGTLPNSSTPSLTGSLEGTRRAYVSASLVLGSIYCLSCLILVFGVREQPGPLSPLGKVGLPFTSCLRMIVGHKPYTQLLCGFLFASLAFQVMQGIFAFFCTHAAGLAGKFQHLVLVMLVTASLSIPLWQWFLGRFGKKTAVTLGLAMIIPALVAITQVSHNFPAFVLLMVVAGCSTAVLYLLPWSMLPDAVDDFMLRNPSCLNLEALFYSFYVFFNKFAGGLAVGISTLGLHFAGYHAGDCTHNPSVTLALKLLMAPVPITLLLIAITIFCLHPINEERRKQMRMELEAMGRQARQGSSEHRQG
ncbi:sodium-dependent lysophosphatidylcholine symporter 1-like isoform X2 [Oxyura jamaicensis]|uniref:sodium-dependent lysophosphatidylcholine symporter 1-like isoform X2 n=1 Tax=Oxyura jamaicensis TaxID=8884 RepID=UPI0015A51194|nr:sodium-dependent lysophosphatidylcholine symporter 1-like isoform X2 [Oxyura jamaicensis]XP_035199473.1 sodium-dependent lysophosphatidylcholine symporter 1-like isoform X2 [Oxyura jamaicensis]XP_035199474.1 sodium-dependent lysophosphatidylcholine symporter 1-like isoform X2 [Oxyura jamaicensis]